MKRLLFASVVFVCASSAALAAPVWQSWTVDFGGFGPVRLGMTVGEAQRLLSMPLVKDDYLEDESCRYYSPGEKSGLHIAFMTDGGRIVRMDVFPGAGYVPATDKGAKVGDGEPRVLALYRGHVKVTPHHYTGPQGHYLEVSDDKGQLSLIFETDGKKVENYRVGRKPAVEYVEGCL